MSRMSVATIDAPEFVNINSISPLVSKCEVKVLYVGANRNRSFITKEVATEMAQTLPGCPIVGYYVENKEDFGDHGDQIIIDGEGVKFKKLTKPYGFVAPDSKIWFQKFEDTDEFGNTVEREYLMTEGYLWTGQFEECQRVINEGNPQSMELDEKTLKGYWSTDTNKGVEFFIINDAMFSKLCILGEDVEPCFEGANITSPELSTKFSKNDNFIPSLFSMMEELKTTLKEGGYSMHNTEAVKETSLEETPVVEKNFENSQDNTGENVLIENNNTLEEFKKAEDEEKKEEKPSDDSKEDSSESKDSDKADSKEDDEDKKKYAASKEEDKKEEEDKKDDNSSPAEKDEDKEEDDKKKYQLLEKEYTELQNNYSLLEAEVKELRKFKADVEDAQKDAMIEKFSMLTEEDKKEIVENKSKYTVDEIEKELSVIFTRKQTFDSHDEVKEETAPLTYNLDSLQSEEIPEWLKAVEETQKRNQ